MQITATMPWRTIIDALTLRDQPRAAQAHAIAAVFHYAPAFAAWLIVQEAIDDRPLRDLHAAWRVACDESPLP